jgi:hypothetical protein
VQEEEAQALGFDLEEVQEEKEAMSGTLSKAQVRRIVAAAGLGAGATLAMTGVAQASPLTYTVGDASDGVGASDCASDANNTDCTLRQAILDANGNAGADTINFNSSLSGSTIPLLSDLPKITESLSINGLGADSITIDGGDAHRIFDVSPTPAGDPVSISGLTLTHGNPDTSTPSPGSGGAILNETADLTLSESVVTGNTAKA